MKNQNNDKQPAIPASVLESLQYLLDYVHDDAKESYDEADGPEGHIFEDIQLLETWLTYLK